MDAPDVMDGPDGMDAPVLYAVTDHVARLTLNRPAASNAIDLELAEALHQAVARAAADAEARVVLLCGAGRLFCAGGDLAAMDAAPDRPAFIATLAEAAHAAVLALDELEKPVVVAVQGAAAGIGLSLVLGADLVIAGRSSRFVTAYTTLGLTPDGGMSWRLPRIIGQRRAAELILTSEPVDAERALSLGLVSQICEDTDVLSTAEAAAARLAARPGAALGQARRLVRSSWAHSLEEHLDVEAATITAASGEPEAGALIAAFLSRARAR